MKLSDIETDLFYGIWFDLLWSINIKHKIIEKFSKPSAENPLTIPLESFTELRDQMWGNPSLIDEYLTNKRGVISDETHEIITGWRNNFVNDSFFVIKYLKKYSVLLSSRDPQRLYGISGIFTDFSELNPQALPYMLETVLIPFKGRIIYDSLMKLRGLTFGPGIRSSLNEQYKEIKSEHGIITTLPDKNA